MKSNKWTPSDLTQAKPIKPGCSALEFQDNSGEYHYFELLVTPEKILFGGCCNIGFLESGFILRDETEYLDDTLQELLSDLRIYYNDGPEFVSRIVCNECM